MISINSNGCCCCCCCCEHKRIDNYFEKNKNLTNNEPLKANVVKKERYMDPLLPALKTPLKPDRLKGAKKTETK